MKREWQRSARLAFVLQLEIWLLLGAPVTNAQVAPLPDATVPPPIGQAYVLGSPAAADWLTLVTSSGRWNIRLDQQTCGPAVIPPASNVEVTGFIDAGGLAIDVLPIILNPQGQFVPDPQHPCPIEAALFAGTTPCAKLGDQCDVAAESADLAGEP